MTFQHLVDGCQAGIHDILHLEGCHRRRQLRAVYVLITCNDHVGGYLRVVLHNDVYLTTVANHHLCLHANVGEAQHILFVHADAETSVGAGNGALPSAGVGNSNSHQRVVVLVDHAAVYVNGLPRGEYAADNARASLPYHLHLARQKQPLHERAECLVLGGDGYFGSSFDKGLVVHEGNTGLPLYRFEHARQSRILETARELLLLRCYRKGDHTAKQAKQYYF